MYIYEKIKFLLSFFDRESNSRLLVPRIFRVRFRNPIVGVNGAINTGISTAEQLPQVRRVVPRIYVYFSLFLNALV